MTKTIGRGWVAGVLALAAVVVAAPAQAEPGGTGTPAEMVATYQTLADAILAVKATEANLVRTMLGAAYAHAQMELTRARTAIGAKDMKTASAAVESLAARVGQLGSEGDNAIGAVRKRLLEGGHHHNSEGEKQGIYDEGYVVVTRAAKKSFLDASKAIGQMAQAPQAAALEAEWAKVQAAWGTLQPAK
ncbi:MAG TPA: hypothetical protein VMQ62_01980 [Dongiaceae bacterium]|nr:hypothetical protein [Dongiaceae bacterium]